MLMLPIVVGGDGDVAAYQYIVEFETFTLHNMKQSYQQFRIPFINIYFIR